MAQTISFRVGNNGPELSPATVVSFTGLENLTLLSVDIGERPIIEWDESTFTWSIGDLLSGQTAEITITAANPTGEPQEVVASITGRLRDPDTDNNTISWTFAVE